MSLSYHSEDIKERVRAATDIVDLIGSRLELRRQGPNYVALCPWHSDRRPSLSVNPTRQIWKCWVCDIGGDVFNFVMQDEGLTFREALEKLAARAGIPLEEKQTQRRRGRGATGASKQELHRVLEWAADYYHQQLLESEQAAAARSYLEGRGISAESIQRFQIGFAPPGWSTLTEAAEQQQIAGNRLALVGLAIPRESRGVYDRFRNRIMFPIRDRDGHVIAFGGRILPGDESNAKYINSPETPLFRKNQQLYGFDLANPAIRQSRVSVVVEGYTDVVIAHQFGIGNAVAVLGTALGESHLKTLRHYCDRVVLVLDGDQAGQRRSDEVLSLFLRAQMDVRVLTLPDGMDPADFLLQYGPDDFRDRIQAAHDALEFKLQRVATGFDPLADTHRANEAIEEMLSLLAQVNYSGLLNSDAFRLRQHQVLGRLARTFGVDEEVLRRRLSDLRNRASRGRRIAPASDAKAPVAFHVSDLSPFEQELFELLVLAPQHASVLLERMQSESLESEAGRALLRVYEQLELDGKPLDFDSVLLSIELPEVKSLLVSLQIQAEQKDQRSRLSIDQRLQTFTYALGERHARKTLEQLTAELANGEMTDQEELQMLQNILREQRLKQGIVQGTDREKKIDGAQEMLQTRVESEPPDEDTVSDLE